MLGLGGMPVTADQVNRQAFAEFQRAADSYAFQHRQVQRRLGDSPDPTAMRAAMRAARPAPVDGELFTPVIAAAFRAQIAVTFRAGGCTRPDAAASSSVVPHPNDDASATIAIPECLKIALPTLPPELEYRVAGVALVLVDIHGRLVVDILHGAFP
jgi:hypothetical protein